MKWSPRMLRRALNIYGPYWGAGIRVDHISEDWRRARVSMELRWFNRNAVGTHFGGSLYSMVDPQLMLMLMNILGPEYTVWDKAATIDFVRPGTGRVHAEFEITEAEIQIIREQTRDGNRYLPEFLIEVRDRRNKIVASVKKTLYVRRRRTELP